MAYDGTSVKDLVATTPTEGSSTVPELNDAIREIKTVLKGQFATVVKALANSPYTVLEADNIILCNANDGNITVNLPSIADVSSTTFKKEYLIIKTDASANTVTIDGYATETINGATTKVLNTQYEGALLIGSGGTEWSSPVIARAAIAEKILVSANDTTGGYLNGKLVAGDNVTLTEGNDAGDETLTVAATQPVRDKYRTLNISSTAVTTVVITATDLVLQNADGSSMLLATVSETAAITAAGANGLDTGTEAINTWYYIWIIGKADGTIDSLLSASSTAPTMPDGYTFKALIGAVRNNASGNFLPFYQRNNVVQLITPVQPVDGGTAYAHANIAINGYVPIMATKIHGYGKLAYVNADRTLEIAGFTGSTAVGAFIIAQTNAEGDYGYFSTIIANSASMGFSYKMSASGGCTVDIFITGWDF